MSPRAGPEEPPDDAPLFDGKVLTSAEIEKRLKAWREGKHLSDYASCHNAGLEEAALVCDVWFKLRGDSESDWVAKELAEQIRSCKRKP